MKKIKIEIKWAFYYILMTLVWMLAEKLTGLHDAYIDYHMYLTNLFILPSILFMVLALKEKKKKFYDNKMSYSQGFLSGLIITLIITLFSPLTQWIISYVITPEFFTNVIKRSVELGYYSNIAEAEKVFNYSSYALGSLTFSFMFFLYDGKIAFGNVGNQFSMSS